LRVKPVSSPADFLRMREPDVLKLDDLLLRWAAWGGLLVPLLGILGFLIPEAWRGSNATLLVGLGFSALAPISMLLLGLRLRKREHRALALMHLVDRQVEIVAADLLGNSDFTRESLETAIRDLSSSGLRHVVWDREEGLIQDGRLRQSRLHIETCAACGVKISLDVPLHEAAAARCPSCDSLLDTREIADEKQAVISELSRRAEPAKPMRGSGNGEFSPLLFVLLLAFFWPLGLLYGAKHWQVGRGEGDL
jgi:hypothetical protein